MERVMRNLTAFHTFSASCFRAAASHSELLATKRRDCLGTDNWEHLQLAELINLYKCCYFMRCFSQPWLNSMLYWFNTLLYGSPDLFDSWSERQPWSSLLHVLGKIWHWRLTGRMWMGSVSFCWKGVQPAETRVQTCLRASHLQAVVRGCPPLGQPSLPLRSQPHSRWVACNRKRATDSPLRFPTPLYSVVFFCLGFLK